MRRLFKSLLAELFPSFVKQRVIPNRSRVRQRQPRVAPSGGDRKEQFGKRTDYRAATPRRSGTRGSSKR